MKDNVLLLISVCQNLLKPAIYNIPEYKPSAIPLYLIHYNVLNQDILRQYKRLIFYSNKAIRLPKILDRLYRIVDICNKNRVGIDAFHIVNQQKL